MRCFRGFNELAVEVDFSTRRVGSSSSEDDMYCAAERVAFLGLERVARDALGGANVVASFGLGLRRRAMSASCSRWSGRDM